MTRRNEFEQFDSTMRRLMSVSHDKLKAALDAEKREKAKKRKSKTSASDRASRERD